MEYVFFILHACMALAWFFGRRRRVRVDERTSYLIAQGAYYQRYGMVRPRTSIYRED